MFIFIYIYLYDVYVYYLWSYINYTIILILSFPRNNKQVEWSEPQLVHWPLCVVAMPRISTRRKIYWVLWVKISLIVGILEQVSSVQSVNLNRITVFVLTRLPLWLVCHLYFLYICLRQLFSDISYFEKYHISSIPIILYFLILCDRFDSKAL